MTPKEVKKHKLLDVCELVPGTRGTKSKTGIFPIYGAGLKSTGMSDEANSPAGSIRLTRKGSVGDVYLHDEPFWAGDDCFIVEAKEEVIDKMYLLHWLLMKQKELAACAEGTTIPRLNFHQLSSLEIEVPDIEYQKESVTLLEGFLDRSEWFIQSIPTEIDLLQRKARGHFDAYINKLVTSK